MSAAHRFSGSLFDLDGPGFVPAREDVKGNPAAEAARDAKFRIAEIDQARADNLPAPQRPLVVMGAIHERVSVDELPRREREESEPEPVELERAEAVRPAKKKRARTSRRTRPGTLTRESSEYWRCIEKALRVLLRRAP